jgi:hypothetical protein
LSVTCGSSGITPGPLVSSTNKTDLQDITEILLKVALNTIKPNHKIRLSSLKLSRSCIFNNLLNLIPVYIYRRQDKTMLKFFRQKYVWMCQVECVKQLGLSLWLIYKYIEKFEDTIGVIRSRQSKHRKCNSQQKKDKQWSTKHYTEN